MRHDFFVTVLLHLKFRRCLLREPIHGKRAAKGTKEPRHRDYFDARIRITPLCPPQGRQSFPTPTTISMGTCLLNPYMGQPSVTRGDHVLPRSLNK